MNNEEMVKMEADMKDVFAKSRGHNRLIAMFEALSDETLKSIFREAVATGHVMALTELPRDVVKRAGM